MLSYIAKQNTKNETNDIILPGKKATVMHINTELCSLHGTVLSELFPGGFVYYPDIIPDFWKSFTSRYTMAKTANRHGVDTIIIVLMVSINTNCGKFTI